MKKCKKCFRLLPKNSFDKHSLTRDRLNPICKECRRINGAKRYQNAKSRYSEDSVPAVKVCSACGKKQANTRFKKYVLSPDGLSGVCRPCLRLATHTDAFHKRRNERWRKRYREDENFKRRHRSWGMKHKYGISLEQYEQLLEHQNDSCALCEQKQAGRRLAIDHDHNHCKPGCPACIRGLLCIACNRVLLPMLERWPRLQSDVVKKYLADRPFQTTASTI